MHAELPRLREAVAETARATPIGEDIAEITLESAKDDEGTDFLRVVIHLKRMDDNADSDLEALLEAIEDAVGKIDDRYPSVRFSDAA
jgi:hypothetical protein